MMTHCKKLCAYGVSGLHIQLKGLLAEHKCEVVFSFLVVAQVFQTETLQ